VTEWNSLHHAVASAFLSVVYSDYMLTSQTETLYCHGKSYKPEDLRNFATFPRYAICWNKVQ
jgi:endoglucanase